jgi:hypothetical protein
MTVEDLPGVIGSAHVTTEGPGFPAPPPPLSSGPGAPARQRSLTPRSVLIGAAFAAAVCGLTPLSDLTVNDTSLVSGFVPLGAVLALFLLVVGINAPLHRWRPRHALRSGEMAVILMMTLVSCGLPNWGLTRFFVPTPVAPFHIGASDQTFWKAFLAMDLPHWLFPVPDVKSGRVSPVAEWFFTSAPDGAKIPYSAWITPLLGWGVFLAGMLTTLVALGRLLIDQWLINERAPFPLVQVQASLIEDPKPGHAFNAMFRSPVLWVGLLSVMAIHLLTCLNTYFPRYFPVVPLKFELSSIFSDEPFSYLRPKLKAAMVSFTVVGITYFIRSRAAFSLWAFYVIVNLVEVEQAARHTEMVPAAWTDQHLGACVAFLVGMLWIGRRQWWRVVRSAVWRPGGVEERPGQTRSYRLCFWAAALGIATMVGWLCVVGVHWWMAAAIVAFILTAHLVVTRVVAETGLPFYRSNIDVSQIYNNANPRWFSMRDAFFSGVFSNLGPQTTRDSVMVFTTTGVGVCEEAGVERERRRNLGGPLFVALLIGFVVAVGVTLHCQYSYSTPLDKLSSPKRNFFGAEYAPTRNVAQPVDQFARTGKFFPQQHDPFLHMAIGFVTTVLLQAASLRWGGWPLLPVGYIASNGPFIENAWFSIFLGWLAQLLIVKFGGASLFQKAKPFFIGIIFGESLAAGIWLIVNAIVVLNGGTGQSVRFLL